MVSVIIRNKNEQADLEHILGILTTRYKGDISQIIIVDNQSTDNSKAVALKYGCTILDLENFGFGRALNLGMAHATSPVVVSLSPYCYPVNTDFFKNIIAAFAGNEKLAGVRFLQSNADFRNFMEGRSAIDNLAACGLASSASAVRRAVWEKINYHDTMPGEDKDWTKKVIRAGYEVRFTESFCCYFKKRTNEGSFNRYKQEHAVVDILYGGRITTGQAFVMLTRQLAHGVKQMFIQSYYSFKSFSFTWGTNIQNEKTRITTTLDNSNTPPDATELHLPLLLNVVQYLV